MLETKFRLKIKKLFASRMQSSSKRFHPFRGVLIAFRRHVFLRLYHLGGNFQTKASVTFNAENNVYNKQERFIRRVFEIYYLVCKTKIFFQILEKASKVLSTL